ncbi:MAG: acyl carrier protein [Clostridia bacterium]|nr:acyl carrier protein [Clostridia bacterium]
MENRVREIVAGYMGILVSEVIDDKSFIEMGMDSLTLLKIIIDIENEYDISIADEEIVDIRNFADICKLIEKNFS